MCTKELIYVKSTARTVKDNGNHKIFILIRNKFSVEKKKLYEFIQLFYIASQTLTFCLEKMSSNMFEMYRKY
jgi:hypothetical protein